MLCLKYADLIDNQKDLLRKMEKNKFKRLMIKFEEVLKLLPKSI